MDDQNKNLILAVVLSGLVMLVWMTFFAPEEPVADPNAVAEQTIEGGVITPPSLSASTAAAPETAAPVVDTPRLTIDTPRLTGSISLKGGRIDTLALKDYREQLDEDSELVSLLRPVGEDFAYYALFGWSPAGDLATDAVPGPETTWTATGSDTLSVGSPLTLTWDNGAGLIFRRDISVDEDYLFSVRQSVENTGSAPVRLAPYGQIARHGRPDGRSFYVLHEGVVRHDGDALSELSYKDLPDLGTDPAWGPNSELTSSAGKGWIGFTDKYWMTSLIPDQSKPYKSVVQYVASQNVFQLFTRAETLDVAPGATATASTQLFAGAKEWETIKEYQSAGIHNFIDSIDWGWFFFLTKPIFSLLHWLNGVIGNMGWSIIVLTLIIKAILFPLAYKSYVSMAKMKELQPEMEKLKESAGDDRAKLQQGMMELYKKNKVNPASGCLPLLLQIPIFFSLYKVIFVTIELRHAPWIGWLKDLSAPDPTSILNLFGLLPFAAPDPESFLALISLGVLPILLGVSMWLQQKLNPAPTDPTQQMIFAWMPWIFMFMLGSFASGLVLYWIANNTITFIQQYTIMRSQGYKPDVLGNILSGFKRKKGEAK